MGCPKCKEIGKCSDLNLWDTFQILELFTKLSPKVPPPLGCNKGY